MLKKQFKGEQTVLQKISNYFSLRIIILFSILKFVENY